MSERRLEAVAEAIHDADYAHEPWKTFESLHDDDKDHYRRMAEAALNALQLTEEWGVITDMGVASTNPLSKDKALALVERYDDMAARCRLASPWRLGGSVEEPNQ